MRNKIRWGLAVAAGLAILTMAPRANAHLFSSEYDRDRYQQEHGQEPPDPNDGSALNDRIQLFNQYMRGPSQQQLDERRERDLQDAERIYLLNHMWDRR